jgi:hypothetical protein
MVDREKWRDLGFAENIVVMNAVTHGRFTVF